MSLKRKFDSRDTKREDYISWEDFFMGIAQLAALRSKDPCTQVGACIVDNDNKVVGVGYNGFPKGCSDDDFSWARRKTSCDNKHLYVCHAETNAILNMNSKDGKKCKIYVTLFPCNECAKIIIQSGIEEVFYENEKNCKDKNDEYWKAMAAKRMFDAAKVKYSKFTPKVNIRYSFIKKESDGDQNGAKMPRNEESIKSSD